MASAVAGVWVTPARPVHEHRALACELRTPLPAAQGRCGARRRGAPCRMEAAQRAGQAAATPRVVCAAGAGAERGELSVTEQTVAEACGIQGLHHVGLLCQDLQRSLDFYSGLLGLPVNDARPDHKLPYGGRWLWAGSGMIHLMELPSPDPVTGRPKHGGHDKHACIQVADVGPLKAALDRAGIPYTASQSGRPAIFCRDPDGNALEFAVFE